MLQHKAYWAMKNLNMSLNIPVRRKCSNWMNLTCYDNFPTKMIYCTRKRKNNCMINTFETVNLSCKKMYCYSIQDSSYFIYNLKVDSKDHMSYYDAQVMEPLNFKTIRNKILWSMGTE